MTLNHALVLGADELRAILKTLIEPEPAATDDFEVFIKNHFRNFQITNRRDTFKEDLVAWLREPSTEYWLVHTAVNNKIHNLASVSSAPILDYLRISQNSGGMTPTMVISYEKFSHDFQDLADFEDLTHAKIVELRDEEECYNSNIESARFTAVPDHDLNPADSVQTAMAISGQGKHYKKNKKSQRRRDTRKLTMDLQNQPVLLSIPESDANSAQDETLNMTELTIMASQVSSSVEKKSELAETTSWSVPKVGNLEFEGASKLTISTIDEVCKLHFHTIFADIH